MALDAWYKVVTPRKEVREGRSFDPSEFAIALEQVVAGTAPEDYRKPELFFARTCWTRALTEHVGMVLRRLAGESQNTSPVMTLITQFGGGKTHTLTTLYHLAKLGPKAKPLTGIKDLWSAAQLVEAPEAAVGVFVGNAWDPVEGRETPWLDLAWQIAGKAGVDALGPAAKTTPPGTEALGRVFALAGKPVLILCDEVLNFTNRHRAMAEPFHAFIQNLTVAMTGTPRGSAVISLPRSQVEMTDWDLQWQDKITKVVRRVAKDLIANDEGEISEVIRRRLFDDLGSDRVRKNVARTYADWCFDRRAQLPSEWTAVDTTNTEKKAREFLQARFEACYPFHPATLSVFQRKWQALPQFQQTRGTLAMLAQWISWVFGEHHRQARNEPLITLGSAPLHHPGFRAVVLGQIGEMRLKAAIETDLAGDQAHAKVLDADAKGPLKDIHRRVGTAILFESSGGQREKIAHLPELRFALGEPEVETTSVDNAAIALERRAFFLQKVGSDGFKVFHKAKIDKAVHDRKASLDDETDVRPIMRQLVEEEFKRGATLPLVRYPEDDPIQDSPRLTLVVVDPVLEWNGGDLKDRIAQCTKNRGKSSRLYPGSLVWCVRKPGRDFREKVELLQAWRRVQRDVRDGVLGPDFEKADHQEIATRVRDAEEAARDEVWAGYRFAVLADAQSTGGLKVIDLGAGHSSGSESLCGRIIAALKAEALLNESVGAGYIDRNWPPAFKESGAWPMASLRQSFLNGALTRLVDPDRVLQDRIVQFVRNGEFGLASGPKGDGAYERVWFEEAITPDEVAFEPGVLLLKKQRAQAAKAAPNDLKPSEPPVVEPVVGPAPTSGIEPPTPGAHKGAVVPAATRIRLLGTVPAEQWNRMGTKILPKLRGGSDLRIEVVLSVEVDGRDVGALRADLKQAIEDLGLADALRVETQDGA
jgi:hypothetical protein